MMMYVYVRVSGRGYQGPTLFFFSHGAAAGLRLAMLRCASRPTRTSTLLFHPLMTTRLSTVAAATPVTVHVDFVSDTM